MENVLNAAPAVLAAGPVRWNNLTQTLPAALLTRPAAPGEWSALECLQHLVDTEAVFQFRVEAFLAGRDFPNFDPDSQGTRPDAAQPPAELAAEYARLRALSLAALAQLTPADLARTAIHQELGRVTLSEMLHEWAGHDLMHTVQAEQALMQPFIQASGPWQSYFTKHIVTQATA